MNIQIITVFILFAIILLCQMLRPSHSYIYIKNQAPHLIKVNTYISSRLNLTSSCVLDLTDDLNEIIMGKAIRKTESWLECGENIKLVSAGLIRSQSSSCFRYNYDNSRLCLIKIMFPNGHFFFIKSIRDKYIYTITTNEEGQVFITLDSSNSSSESPTIEKKETD